MPYFTRLYLYAYEYFEFMYIFAIYVCTAHGGHKGASYALELLMVSQCIGAANQILSSARVSSALNHQASPQPLTL